MTAQILPFQRPPKLSPGERPKRRTDVDRLQELREIEGQLAARLSEPESCIDFAKLGAPPESA